MDDQNRKPTENPEVKEGYVQLVEKMEQVKNQVAKIERKYDELYQSLKEKDKSRNESVASEASKSQRDTVDAVAPERSLKEAQNSRSDKTPEDMSGKKNDMDLEKMEDNPFL